MGNMFSTGLLTEQQPTDKSLSEFFMALHGTHKWEVSNASCTKFGFIFVHVFAGDVRCDECDDEDDDAI